MVIQCKSDYIFFTFRLLFSFILFFSRIFISFPVPPQVFPFSFGEESVNSGDLTSVTCSVHKGDLPMTIEWLHNNQNVATLNGVMITQAGKKISTLSIESVSADHAGLYTCLARNQAGNSSHTSVLNVNGTFISRFKDLLVFCLFFKILKRDLSSTTSSLSVFFRRREC